MAPGYDIDGEDFFLGCGLVEIEPGDAEFLPDCGWGGFTHLAIPGLRDAWSNADARRAEHASRMSALRATGAIPNPPTTPELRATRRRTVLEVWERRRRGELPKPVYPNRSLKSLKEF